MCLVRVRCVSCGWSKVRFDLKTFSFASAMTFRSCAVDATRLRLIVLRFLHDFHVTFDSEFRMSNGSHASRTGVARRSNRSRVVVVNYGLQQRRHDSELPQIKSKQFKCVFVSRRLFRYVWWFLSLMSFLWTCAIIMRVFVNKRLIIIKGL